ncbi:hypothetical protein ABIC28_001613 [Rhodococcus sp. PvR044]|uniref:hypothetical protein n=1 Tax=Rhodococcus sp. PvR044 TaxID=3156402 RepID=UPI00339B1CE6
MTNPSQTSTDGDRTEFEEKLDDIANDPSLTVPERIEAMGEATRDEIDSISAGTGLDATSDTAPTDSDSTVSVGDALDEIDATIEDLESIGSNDIPEPTDTSAPETAPADSDVIGDPDSATYSADPSEPITDPTTTAPASSMSGGVSEANPAIGVTGTVDYYSPRDVDRDGTVDITHSRVDGVDTITHYDQDGNITLVEQDSDHNGTYDSAVSSRADGTIRLAEDRDDDGAVDLVTYGDQATGLRTRQDVIENGKITDSRFDTDGDGQPDVYLVDTDGNGRFDTAMLDTDADAITNETLVDTDGDGRFDLSSLDADNDGSQESIFTAGGADAGGLGDISTYESLIPADDSYHAQADADTYEPPAVHEAPGDLA